MVVEPSHPASEAVEEELCYSKKPELKSGEQSTYYELGNINQSNHILLLSVIGECSAFGQLFLHIWSSLLLG